MEKTDQTTDDQEEIKRKVVNAIKDVYDPEIPVDVYELGLIYEITVYPVNNVYILMTLTSPNCPAAESIPSEVKTSVSGIEGVNNVEVAKLELGFL